MNRTAIILATTLALLVALPAAAQAKKKPARRAVPVVAPLVLPPATSEQLAAAALILLGDYACEFGKSLRVSLNPKFDGYVDLLFDKQLFTLKPVLSHTGALLLEDVRGRLLLVQIAVKSMVMDVKIGQRRVDDCVHETHSENRRQLDKMIASRSALPVKRRQSPLQPPLQPIDKPAAQADLVTWPPGRWPCGSSSRRSSRPPSWRPPATRTVRARAPRPPRRSKAPGAPRRPSS